MNPVPFLFAFHLACGALIPPAGLSGSAPDHRPGSWGQFRGPNGQGTAPEARIPTHFGPATHVLWKCALPPGHSSPVVGGDQIFLTACDPTNRQALLTLAIRREDGAICWQTAVTAANDGPFHALNNPAASTPATDERHVYVYFGTYGLVCYDHAGQLVWERKLPLPPSKYGMATSPILYQEKLLLVLDGDGGSSRLLAAHRDTGATIWEAPRPLFKAGWSTPVIWRHDGRDELVVLGSRRLTAYDLESGSERWWAGGFPEETVGVPVLGDGLVFAGAAALGGRGDDGLDAAATWKMTVEAFDRDHDNQIRRDEMTEGFAFIQRPELPRDNPGYGLPVRDMDVLLRMFDHNRDRVISEREWMDTMAGFAAHSQPYLLALRPGASGDARPAHLAWEIRRGIPETPSPLCWQGRLYLLRDGGLLTCLEASTGRELFRERLGAAGQYIASPIIAGDKLLAASASGVITVIEPADELRVRARNDFGEAISATPAVQGNRLYVRTAHHLYALGEP